MKKKLSIIIVTYNSSGLIKNCLDTIFRYNDIGKNLEVLIVDNNSQDFTVLENIINDKYSSSVKLIRNNVNSGYGSGNNIGILKSKGDIILIVNPDVYFFKPIFKQGLEYFDKNEATAIVGLQQFEKLNVKSQSFLMRKVSIYNLLLHKFHSILNIFNQKYFCFSGACFFIKKNDLLKIGLFDEDVFLYGEESYVHHCVMDLNRNVVYAKELGYIHPIHERELSLKDMKLALISYEQRSRKLGLDFNKELIASRRMYYLLYAKSLIFNKKTDAEYYYNVIKLYSKILHV